MGEQERDRGTSKGGKTSFQGLVQAGVVILAFATVSGFCGDWFWFLDLFAHFRVQYFLASVILGILLLVLRSFRFGLVSLIVAAANLVLLMPFYGGASVSPPQGETWKALLYNVNTRAGSPTAVVELVRDLEPDVVVLLEIDDRWVPEISEISADYPNQVLKPRPDNFGIGLLSKFPLLDSKTVLLGSAEVPTILANVETSKGAVQVVATHPLPPIGSEYTRKRDEQLRELPGVLSPTYPVLLLGDLNTTPWGHSFRSLLAESTLQDSMRGFGIQPSWPTGNLLFKIPLDHVLHSDRIQIHERKLGRHVGSDHLPVFVEFSLREEKGANSE